MSQINPVKRAAPKPEADKTRIIFKHVLETIRRLDEISKGKTALRDVYSAESIQLRRRLKDYCERLLFVSPVEYGRKTEELLWRKAFYDVIQIMKLTRKNGKPSRTVESAYESHLSAAAGFYCHLLFRLQREFKLGLWDSLDFGYYGPKATAGLPGRGDSGSSVDERVRQWARRACQRCLIYLGDLARYQREFAGNRSWILAQRYYYQAFLLDPDNGMPHNQLGTLVGTRYYGLDAAYHYIRCLSCVTKFDGASGNLDRIFEKNRKRYHELTKGPSQRHLSVEQQRMKDIRRLCIRFLRLVDILYRNPSSVEPRELQLLCQDVLQDFSLCLFYTSSGSVEQQSPRDKEEDLADEKMLHLEDEIIAKIVILVIIVVHKLQANGSKQVAAAIAFNLAVFSNILNHVRLRLQSSLEKMEKFELQPSATATPAPDSDEDDRRTPTAEFDGPQVSILSTSRIEESLSGSINRTLVGDASLNESRPVRHQKRKLTNRRRRRRNSSEDSSEDLSEGEMTSAQRTTAALSAMVSDEEEEMNYLNKRRQGSAADKDDALSTSSETSACSSSSSDSSSDEIGMLMESQELRPGFLSGTTTEQADDVADRGVLALQKSLAASSGPITLHTLLSGSASVPVSSNGFVGYEDDLQRLSFDLLARVDASAPSDDGVAASGLSSSRDNPPELVSSVPRPVRLPPGFDKDDPEVRHVKEINDKLATYVIDTDTNSSIPTESDTAEGESSGDESVVRSLAGTATPRDDKNIDRLMCVITNEGLMSTIKILCDWLRWQPQIVSTCIQSSPSLWSRMATFLNFLPQECDLAAREGLFRLITVRKHVRVAASCGSSPEKWAQRYGFREDVHLRKLAAVSAAHASIDFDDRVDMTSLEEAMLRVCHLRVLGYHMAANSANSSSFSYDSAHATFLGPAAPSAVTALSAAPPPPSQPSVARANGTSAGAAVNKPSPAAMHGPDSASRKDQLMRDMAQLRLQAEVSELEDSVKKLSEPSSIGSLPPYLVTDAAALCEHGLLVRQLVASGRFIVIVPQAVIDQLDEMKKESAFARDTIRWLETEFQKGNRHVRAQKSHERTFDQSEQTLLRRKDKESWRALELIDCCKFLAEHHAPSESVTGFGCGSGIAAVLTGKDPAVLQISLPTVQGLRQNRSGTALNNVVSSQPPSLFCDVASDRGVTVFTAAQFLDRWNQATAKTK